MGLYFGAGGAGGFCAEAIPHRNTIAITVQIFDEIIAVVAVLFALKQIPFAGILGDVQFFNPLLWRPKNAGKMRTLRPARALAGMDWMASAKMALSRMFARMTRVTATE